MKSPWIIYTVTRLGLFFGIFIVLALLGFNPFFSAIIAAVVSFALSLVFLDKQRRAISEKLHKTSSKDADSDYENELMDDLETDQTDPDGEGDSPRN
jgi:mannitol-specific phosphotransferase system IIBC component